jgi:sodium/potassium/calcium exchanger 6
MSSFVLRFKQFLSFGNGSPDVFSNIAAFSSSTPKIGVASILGGGLLVTTVIAASVGLASQGQHQLIPRKYIRDVFFYFIGVTYFAYLFLKQEVSAYLRF